jgi:hypothetical protein
MFVIAASMMQSWRKYRDGSDHRRRFVSDGHKLRRALACGSRKRAGSGVHTPQHFLYFLPLPHGHGSFLPVLGFVFLI